MEVLEDHLVSSLLRESDRLHTEINQIIEEATTGDGRESRAAELLPEDVLLLDHARRIALVENPDIHAARARLAAAMAGVAEARSRFFPSLIATHTSTRTFHTPASRNRLNLALQPIQPVPTDTSTDNIVVTTLVNALRLPFFGGNAARGDSSPFSEHSSSLTLAWTVFDGFVRDNELLSSRHLQNASVMSAANVERVLIRAVDRAYYQVQLAREQLRVARADERFSRNQLRETQKLRDAQRATAADVGNFEVRLRRAQVNVTTAIGARDTGRVALAELMGVADVALPEGLALSPLADETEAIMTLPFVDDWIDDALENRPDIAELKHVVESRANGVRAAKGLYSPLVQVSGSWGFDRTSNVKYSVEDQSSAAGIEFQWDLFTGGARRARVLQAQSAWAEAAAHLKRLRLAVQSEVTTALIELKKAQEQIRLQRKNLETAGENRRVIEEAYRAGKETLTRLNEAQRDFVAADADLAFARIRLRQAWSALYAAAGAYRNNMNGGPEQAGEGRGSGESGGGG